jgi:creatinine amidohydrolase
MSASIHFADLTSPRARALLDNGPAPVLLLPVGAVEPHGPHAPLGTDSIISTAICERAAEALSGDTAVRALVLPEIAFGVTRYSAAFTGAITISEGTLHAMVVEVCASLGAQGFRHQVIVNSHFEPAQVATLRRAAEDAKVGFLDLTRRAVAQQLTPEFQSGAAHAGRYETSVLVSTPRALVVP